MLPSAFYLGQAKLAHVLPCTIAMPDCYASFTAKFDTVTAIQSYRNNRQELTVPLPRQARPGIFKYITSKGSGSFAHTAFTLGPAQKRPEQITGLRMALRLGATGEILLEFRLFGHNLAMAFGAVGVLEPCLGVNHIEQALFTLLGGQVVMAACTAAFGKAFLTVHQMVTGHAFHLFMRSVGKHDGLLGALDFYRFVRSSGCSPSAHGKDQGQYTGESKNFFHGSPPR